MLRQVALNVLLFVPLGLFARHLFGAGKLTGVGLGALVSLLIEVTQLTGIWGLYDCAYRLFDVDDLIANTAGAAVGVFLAPLLGRLPGQHLRPVDQPSPVRPLRRLAAAAADLLSVALIGFVVLLGVAITLSLLGRPDPDLAELVSAVVTPVAAIILLFLVPLRWGATVGQRLVFLRAIRPDLHPPTSWQWAKRFITGVGAYFAFQAVADLGVEPLTTVATTWLVASVLVIVVVHTRGISGYASGLIIVDSRESDLVAARSRSRGVDPRRMSSAVLALGGALYVGATTAAAALASLSSVVPLQTVGLLALLGALALVLAALVLVVYVFHAGVVVVRREGRSVGNLLALASVLALVTILGVFAIAVWTQSRWLIITCVAGLGVSAYLGFLFGAFLLYGQIYARATPGPGIDAVVVLGSRVFGDRVPPLLAARIDRGMQAHAAELRRGGRPLLILSGGQGPDEPAPEGEVMARYAVQHGADPDLVRAETQSTTTQENLTFSAQILAQEGQGTELVVATNDFHAFRAAIIARELGLPAQVVGAPTAHYFFPSAIMREFIGVLSRTSRRHLLASGAIGLVSGALAWVLTSI